MGSFSLSLLIKYYNVNNGDILYVSNVYYKIYCQYQTQKIQYKVFSVHRKPAVIKLCSVCLFLNHCVNLITVVAHHYLHALT